MNKLSFKEEFKRVNWWQIGFFILLFILVFRIGAYGSSCVHTCLEKDKTCLSLRLSEHPEKPGILITRYSDVESCSDLLDWCVSECKPYYAFIKWMR